MREQLQQYVTLLFAGAQDCEDIQQEILQNTLDHYDDLIAQGKCPEAAYRLAISGIGDINEILSGAPIAETPVPAPAVPEEDSKKKMMRAIAVALYILCPVPVILLGSTGYPALAIAGVCGLLAMVSQSYTGNKMCYVLLFYQFYDQFFEPILQLVTSYAVFTISQFLRTVSGKTTSFHSTSFSLNNS